MSPLVPLRLWLVLAAAPVFAGEAALPLPEMDEPVSPESGRLNLNFLPRAFQSNPRLEMSVYTEFTAAGRAQPALAPGQRRYYVGHNSDFQQRGESLGGERPPDPNYLGRVLQHALETTGFFPASDAHPPSLVLVFHWGSHVAPDLDMRMMFPERAARMRLERTALVGGRRLGEAVHRRMSYGAGLLDFTIKDTLFVDQAMQDLYFAVISAYDHAALARGERQLLWRTHLTVGSHGVSATDSLPALVLSGSPYFGRETPEPKLLFRHVRRGVVNYGASRVIESDVKIAPASN